MRRYLCFPLTLFLLLCGCVGAEGLMQAPRPATQYMDLQEQLDALLAAGYVYSAPTSGDHRQAVLMADLTGDGTEVAVVFLRGETDNLLAVFLPSEGEFTALPPVAENVESVHSVVFSDLDGDGRQEIIVGWQVSGLRTISVYAVGSGGLTEIFTRRFSAYTVYDIEGTGVPSLLLIQVDSAEQVVEMVSTRDGDLGITGTAYLSRGAEAVLRIRTSPLLDGPPGLLVTSQYQTSSEVTDVLTFRDGGLVNISANLETGNSDASVRQREIYATDVNGDGVYDLPRMVELPRHPGEDETSDPFYEIRWSSYYSSGLLEETARTYYSFANNWYILLPEQWPELYAVRRSQTSAQTVTQAVNTFSILTEEGPIDFLRIYHISYPAGSRPSAGNRTVLVEQDSLVMMAEAMPLEGDLSRFNVSEKELADGLFRLIPPDWRGF
ncbi:MAG: VCBS repeat-containing protein [Oscillospiraceae bacterium]|nr:VCBS repeat-containing protein [Oscillospiraceae bacterium]